MHKLQYVDFKNVLLQFIYFSATFTDHTKTLYAILINNLKINGHFKLKTLLKYEFWKRLLDVFTQSVIRQHSFYCI